jgi:anti-anti-sigma factor
MKIDIIPRGAYQILRIEEELNVISDLSELRFLIEGYLQVGKRHIALSFTSASYIYSGAIAILIDCYKKIKQGNGELCIIESHPEILQIFRFLNIDRFIHIYPSEKDIPQVDIDTENGNAN